MILKQYIESYTALVNEFLNRQDKFVERYESGDFPRSDRVKDLQERFRWDVFWCLNNISKGMLSSSFFDGANSDHVDTLLRKCTPKISRNF